MDTDIGRIKIILSLRLEPLAKSEMCALNVDYGTVGSLVELFEIYTGIQMSFKNLKYSPLIKTAKITS